MKMRIGKISAFIAQFTRPRVVNEHHVESKAASLLSKLIPKQGQAESGSAGSKISKTIALIGAGVSGLSCTTMAYASDGADNGLDCPCYPWPHQGILGSHDQASTRRGLQVFQDVCSSCHTMSLVSYRNLVDAANTKAMAAEIEVVDGPNGEGEMFARSGKLNDHFLQLYADEKAARLASGRAYPPDLSLITKIKGKHNYNPYFHGGAISMPKMLIEYENESQIGKDGVTSLPWSALLNQKLMNKSWWYYT